MLDFIRGSSGSFLTKIIFGIIILVFIFWGVGNYTSIGQHAVATVNGEQVTTVEFHKTINNALRNADMSVLRSDKAAFDAFKRDSLNRVILQMLVKQEADKLGILVTPQELQQVIVTIPAFQDETGKFSKEQYQTVLKQGQLTPGQFEKDIIDQLLMEKLMSYVAMGVSVTEEEVHNYFNFIREERIAEYVLFPLSDYAKAAKPGEEAITAYYEDNKNSFALPARVEYEYLRVSPESLAASYTIDDAAAKAEYENRNADYMAPREYNLSLVALDAPADGGREKADAIRQTLVERSQAGEKFANLVAEFSVLPEAKNDGGSLGWVKEQDLPAELSGLLADLPVGEISQAHLMQGRWFLFMIEDKKEARLIPFEEVREEIKTALAQQKAAKEFELLLNKADEGLRDGLDIDKLSAELGFPKNTTGLLPIEEADTIVGLTDDSKSNLLGVPSGKAAPAALETEDGFALVLVSQRLGSTIPEIDDVRKEIVDVLTHEKAMELARADAEKCLQDIDGSALPAVYASKTANSKKINRLTPEFSPLHGDAGNLIAALFSVGKDVWLDKAYALDEGVVVARIKSIIAAPEAEWATMSGILTNALLQSKRDMYIRTYIEQLTEKAKIETNEAALDGVAFS